MALQGLALQHAEAVLLVDDAEPEPLEGDALLDERVRADDEVDVAARDGALGPAAELALHAARQSSATRSPIGWPKRRSVAQCCSARSSVGAISAA